jgi:hypothetical protein
VDRYIISRNKGEDMSRVGDLLIGMQEDAECVIGFLPNVGEVRRGDV